MRARKKKEINVLVGENIRAYREQAGMSREKLAELTGVTPRFLADVELGLVGVSLTTLKRICETLGVSADSLLWQHEQVPVDFTQRLSHLDPKYLAVIDELVQKQLEIIALATNDGQKRNTRN